MKLLKLILAFTLLTSCSSAQVTQTVPNNALRMDYPQNGVYFKDLNNEMAHYIGTWEGVQNNKKYIFQFVKFEQHYETDTDNTYYYIDCLKVKFKVIDLSTNQVLYDDTNVTNFDDFKILGLNLKTGKYWYNDKNNCNLNVNFNIHKIANNPNQIKYCYFEYEWYNIEGCPYADTISIPMFLPKEDLILTKQ